MKEAYRMQRWFITMKKADFNRIGEIQDAALVYHNEKSRL